MSVQALGFSEMASMTPEQRQARLEAFINAPLNGELDALNESIRALERRYEMSSATMRQRFRRGELKETEEIGAWLTLLEARDGTVASIG